MEFGISFLPDASPATKSPGEYLRDAIDMSVLAEDLGFGWVKMTEHYLNQYGGYCPSPLAFLSAVAARTTSIRLMTGCIIPTLHHPVALAAETAMVDQISGGRLDVGFARGYMPYEFDAFGIDLDSSRERYMETIDLVRRLWREPEVTHQGRFYTLEHAHSWPRPTAPAGPTVWGAAVRSRQSFAWLGEQNANLLVTPGFIPLAHTAEHVELYRSTRESEGDGSRGRVFASMPLLIAEDHRTAEERGGRLLTEYRDVWASAADSWEGVTSPAYRGYAGMGRGIRAAKEDALISAGGAVIGDAAACHRAESALHRRSPCRWNPLAGRFRLRIPPSDDRDTPAIRRRRGPGTARVLPSDKPHQL